MPSCLKELAAEYERLMADFSKDGEMLVGLHRQALVHILKRLGPPSLTEASEIERREAIAADGE